jgi:hypothetical protein
MHFVNRRTDWNTVRRAGARKDKLVDAALQHFLEQNQRPETVVSVIGFRGFDRLAHIGIGGEMRHHMRPILV